MARRAFDVIDIVEICQHWRAGRPVSEIAASLGVDPKTVRKYIAPAEGAGLVPGGPRLSRAEWEGLVRGWFPGLADEASRSLTHREIDGRRALIEKWMDAGVTVATIHQRLRDEHGLAAKITSMRRYIYREFPGRGRTNTLTIPRPEVSPGEEAQIDWGYLGRFFDPVAGRMRRIWAFAMVLACSRHMFVRPVTSMTQTVWVACHLAAFDFFSGAPARLVIDDLKTGVDRPDLYDPKLNRAYAEMAEHYGCLIDPARRGRPKDKPRVERPVPYIRDSFWAGREWESIEEIQAGAVAWCLQVAGTRRCAPLGGGAPYSVFVATERDALLPLPRGPFEIADWSSPKVAPDSHIKAAGALYSVPHRLIGRRVDAKVTEKLVEVFSDGVLAKTHTRVGRGRRSTDWADYPEAKAAFYMRTPTWCRKRAGEPGPAVAEVVGELLEINALHRLRSAQGIIGLADRYGPGRLDRACRRAIDAGDPSYRTVKGILLASTEDEEVDQAAAGIVAAVSAHLHGKAALFGEHAGADR
jgi:transposase